MKTAKWVADISVQDPNTKNDIEMCLYQHENGAMFAIDFSYMDQCFGDNWVIPDPFSDTRTKVKLLE